MSEEKRIARKFEEEFKINAARLVLEEGLSVTKAANDLGMSANTLHGWVSKFRQGTWNLEGNDSSKTKNKSNCSSLPLTPSKDQRKIQDLEKQLRRLTMERDILKKAMAYCIDLPK